LKKQKLDDSSGQVQDPNTTVVAYKPKADITTLGVYSDGSEWPFEGLCEQLSYDLFSSQWEVRHGAAIGIRQLMKVHGSGYGKVVGVQKSVNDKRHFDQMQDLVIRLLCVLALDQFADFVGDQAVVPVRETCAQALGVVLQYCSSDLCIRLVNEGLLKLLNYTSVKNADLKWATKLSGLIGLKYWMAVRKDLLQDILSPVNGSDSPAFRAIALGLMDKNDDVRAVASSSLLPITDVLITIVPPKKIFDSVVICLWSSLKELDDLTSATASVMDLLSDLIKKPVIESILREEAHQFLNELVPQLFPFFRHAIKSVRLSVLRTLIDLTDLSLQYGSDAEWVTVDLLRLLFQNYVLEENDQVLKLLSDLWDKLCIFITNASEGATILMALQKSTISILLALIMSPIGTPLEERLFISYTSSLSAASKGKITGLNIPAQDRAMMKQDLTVLTYDHVVHGRLAGGCSIGKLLAALLTNSFSEEEIGKLFALVTAYINSGTAFHRIIIGVIIEQLAKSMKSQNPDFINSEGFLEIWNNISRVLMDATAGGVLLFSELAELLRPLYQNCISIQKALRMMGHVTPEIPPPDYDGTNEVFTIASGDFYLEKICAPLLLNAEASLLDLYRYALNSKGTITNLSRVLDTRVYSSFAAAIVSTGKLNSKLNPVIRSLMNSVQTEQHRELQDRSSHAVAQMIFINVSQNEKLSVNDKLVKNCCVYLCSDSSIVGVAKETKKNDGIITMDKIQGMKVAPKKGASRSKKLELDAAATEAIKDAVSAQSNATEIAQKAILHRGAEALLKHLCAIFQGQLFSKVDTIWNLMSCSLIECTPLLKEKSLDQDHQLTQPLIDSLHITEVISQYLHPELYSSLLSLFPMLVLCLESSMALLRHLTSRAIAAIACAVGVPAMIQVIELIIPLAGRSTSDSDRMGSVEAMYHIIQKLEDKVLPYLIFLMAPLLGRMSDTNEAIRFIATNAFAQLVRLAPLEAGVPDPDGFSDAIIQKKIAERKFIGQLIGTEKVQDFELPVSIAAELRSYQKEGVNWLAFLNRYGLHGILCDG
jgi:TATA-binding protein-associated factor